MTNPADAPRAQARERAERITSTITAECDYCLSDQCQHAEADRAKLSGMITDAILEATAALRDEHARLTAERDAARAELATAARDAELYRTAADLNRQVALTAKAEGAREALEQAADEWERLPEDTRFSEWLRARAQEKP